MKRGERKPKMIFDGVGLITPLSDLIDWLLAKGVPVDLSMTLEEILDFARWEERGTEFKLHLHQGQIWQADVRTPVIDGKLHGSRLPGWK